MNKETLDFRNKYSSKFVSMENALRCIHSGDKIIVGHACAEPSALLHSLCEHKDRFKGVEIIHMMAMGKAEYCTPKMAEHFHHRSFFLGNTTREAINSGRGDFYPANLSDTPGLIETFQKPDVCLLTVTPPDENGNCSFSISCDYTKKAAKTAKIRIAEMSSRFPWICGEENTIPISELDYIVESERSPISLSSAVIGDVERQIGINCASLIQDGDCLQLGVGSIPDAVLAALDGKKDLGIHSEMVSNGIVPLIEKGIVNGSKKNLHPGKIVATFLMGNEDFYHFAHQNSIFDLKPVDYVNNPFVIAQNDNLVSINSCLQIDLTGQVASESIGPWQYSGAGGQLDFVLGAHYSKGGRSIMAITSTTAKGSCSRILPTLPEGTIVTTPRNLVDMVVTEYGIARLKGRSTKERAKALIAIAHPDFREGLIRKYEEIFHCEWKE